jgi:hypothetical protein
MGVSECCITTTEAICNVKTDTDNEGREKLVKSSQVNFIPLPSGSIGNKTKYTYMKLQMKNVSDAQPNEYTV